MNKSKSFYAMVFGLALAPLLADAENVTVSVSNNSGMQRQELVEVPVDDVYARLGIQKGGQFIVKNALGQQILHGKTTGLLTVCMALLYSVPASRLSALTCG